MATPHLAFTRTQITYLFVPSLSKSITIGKGLNKKINIIIIIIIHMSLQFLILRGNF